MIEEEKPNVEELEIDSWRQQLMTYFPKSKSLKVHTSEKLEKPCSFTHCAKSFGHSGNLQTHLNVHTKEKP